MEQVLIRACSPNDIDGVIQLERQWEHQKLAGTLALLWGNADFERPPVPLSRS